MFLILANVPRPGAPLDPAPLCRLRVRARWRDDGSVLTIAFDRYGNRHLEGIVLATAGGELALHFLPVVGSA